MLITSNPRLRGFYEDTLNLAASIVIKFDPAIDAINVDVMNFNYTIDKYVPSTWKFYMNIRGQYHATDTMMSIKSIDTLEQIDFTLENMAIHRATANAYSFGSDFYKALVARFPTQELLIRGIINPCPIEEPWNLPDGTILNYETTLIEPREYDLLYDMENWIKRYLQRWFQSDYPRFNDLHVSDTLAGLMTKLLPYILTHRFQRVKTSQTHTFFIREYLRSNMYLDEYVDYLTHRQLMYLYKNVHRLISHAGKESTLRELTSRILIERGVPLITYDIRSDLSQMNSFREEAEYEALEVRVSDDTDTNITTTRTVESLANALDGVAPGNEDATPEDIRRIEEAMRNSRFSRVPTKILESTIIDTSNYTNYSVSDVLFNEWIRMIGEGRYAASFTGSNPVTGETLDLETKDAFLMYIYLLNYRYRGQDPSFANWDIPPFAATSVRVQSLPPFSQLLNVFASKRKRQAVPYINFMLEDQVQVGTYSNVFSFYEYCDAVFKKDIAIRRMFANVENLYFRGEMEAALTLFYRRYDYTLATGNYKDWAALRGVDASIFTTEQIEGLMANITEQLLGIVDTKETTLKSLHSALLGIMERFSSYDTIYLSSVNAEGMLLSDWPSLRIGDVDTSIQYHHIERIADLRSETKTQTSLRHYEYREPPKIQSSESYDIHRHYSQDIGLNADSGYINHRTIIGESKNFASNVKRTYE